VGRRKLFSKEQIEEIRSSPLTQIELAVIFKTTKLTIHKVKNFKEAYRVLPQELGTPVLSTKGEVVGITDL
jgi:hypothetical protein